MGKRKLVKARNLEAIPAKKPTLRKIRVLTTLTSPSLQFRCWKVPGDGNCMYTALWCGMRQKFESAKLKDARRGGLEIRANLSELLKQHVYDNSFNVQFMLYNSRVKLAKELGWHVPDREVKAANDQHNEPWVNENNEPNWPGVNHLREAYYEGVGKGLYGDDLTRSLFELVYNVDVVVYEETGPPDHILRQTANITEPRPITVYLLNVNSKSGGSAHFDLLQPVEMIDLL